MNFNYRNEAGKFLRKKIIKHTALLIFIFIVIGIFLDIFVVVSAGERGILLTFGKVEERIFTEGLNFKIPLFQKIIKMDIKIQKEEIDASAASKDLQIVTAKIALNYHLDESKVNKLWQSVGSDYKSRIIDPAIQEAIKAVTARYTAEELITKRPRVKDDAKIALSERLAKEYILVDELSIVNFDFSTSFNQAIEAKVTAEQNALASKNKLEQVKYEAEQRIAEAKGEAEAINIQAKAIQQQGGAEYVRLKTIEKWDGELPVYSLGDSVPLLNLK